MATQTFQRQLQQIIAAYAGTVETGYIYEAGNKFYIPFLYTGFSTPDLTPTVNATATQTRLNAATPGAFDNIRVGDIVSGLSGAGALTAKATVVRNCYGAKTTDYVVYPSNLTPATLGVSAGDAVTSATTNVVAANTIVEKIDYATFRIFLSNPIGSAGDVVDALTFTPPVRVTAVRKSTATSNANQIDIDTTVATGGSGLTATIKNGAKEAVSHVIRIEPLNSTTNSKVNYSVGVSILNGENVRGSANGLNNVDVEALAYINVGSYSFDADEFLVKARLPRPTTV